MTMCTWGVVPVPYSQKTRDAIDYLVCDISGTSQVHSSIAVRTRTCHCPYMYLLEESMHAANHAHKIEHPKHALMHLLLLRNDLVHDLIFRH